MSPQLPNSYTSLERYVGKVFQMQYSEVEAVCLLGGDCGLPFFLCKWKWSDKVFCAEPVEVIAHFDDNYNPIKDIELPQ